MALSLVHTLESIIVKLVSDSGLVGWGETCPLGPTYQPAHSSGARAALQEIAPLIVGMELTHPRQAYQRMDMGLSGHNYAKAALDIAAHDLCAKSFGIRVCDLLGGPLSESVPSYSVIDKDDPTESALLAKQRIAEGYRRLQIKIGGRPLQQDIERIHRISERTGKDVQLVADANRGLNTRDALLLSHACAGIPLILEQPCNTMEEVASLRGRVRHPIYLDENTESINHVLSAISGNVCDGFGFKITRLGGLTPMLSVRDICAVRSLPHTCDDSWGGDIIAAACVHLGVTVKPQLLEGVWIAEPYIEEHYDPRGHWRVVDGRISLPEQPGLGVEPDETVFGEAVFSLA